jgi:hypothetical protein
VECVPASLLIISGSLDDVPKSSPKPGWKKNPMRG